MHWIATSPPDSSTKLDAEGKHMNRSHKNKSIKAGWLHLPFLPETASLQENLGQPSMSAATALEGLKAAVAAIASLNIGEGDIDDVSFSRLQI